jgi:hypothetical protein
MDGRPRNPADDLAGGTAGLPHPAEVLAHHARGDPGARARTEAFDVPDGLAQPAVLVEVPAHELRRRIVVRVQDRGTRMEDLAPPLVQHRRAEGLILRVGQLGKADLGQQSRR